MITPSRLVKAAVLGCAAAAICSLLPPVATAVAAQKTARTSAVAPVHAVSAFSSGVLTGTVRALGGSGLAGVCVTATGPTGAIHGFTSVGGRYVLSGLRPGEYRVGFLACAQPGRYVRQWYGGALTARGARPVQVVSGHPTLLGPVTLRPANAMAYLAASARASRSGREEAAAGSKPLVSGTVTDTHGKAQAGICVTATALSSGNSLFIRTGRKGTYQFDVGDLKPGRWEISFSVGCGSKGNFAVQWWKAAATENKAKVLVVRSGSHFTGINARLSKGASISGVVRAGSKTGPGLPGACVEADGPDPSDVQSVDAKTGPGGKYLIRGLGTGKYMVFFDPGCGNKGDFTEATIAPIVSVTDGKTTKGVDGFLPRGGAISGTVTGPDHHPLGGICVGGSTESNGVGFGFSLPSRSNGQYALDELMPGRYEMSFVAGCGSKGSFAPQFYQDQVSEAASDLVLVKAGAHVTGIDAVMQPGGVVTGTVTNTSGKKLTGVCVLLARQAEATGGEFNIAVSDGLSDFPFGSIARTVGGRYRAADLAPGNYSASFISGCGRHQPPQASQWFSPLGDGKMSLLTVGTGTVSGIDAKMPAPGTITGVVTGQNGKPVKGVCAVPDALTGQPSDVSLELISDTNPGESNSRGVYQLTGLAAGKYGLEFLPCDSREFAPQWYRQSAEFAGLTPVVVRTGRVTSGINEKMVVGQSVSGRITKAGSGQPVPTACVLAADRSGNIVGFGRTGKDGTYKVGHLAAGIYSLEAGLCESNGNSLALVMRWGVKVGTSKPSTGVNIALPAAGRVTGLVTGGNPAQPVGGVCVTATPKTGSGATLQAFTTSDGKYVVGGLAPGQYRVEFSSLCLFSPGGFVSQWFDGKASRAAATPVGVASGKTTSGIDATLAADGLISGLVRAGGALKPGVCALAFPKAGGTPTVAVTGAKGSYVIGGLAPGRYLVEFAHGCGAASFRTQWFDGASSRKSATPVLVNAGLATTDINAH